MKKILYTFLFCAFASQLFAQLPSCDGNRYKNYVFAAYDSIANVKFGQNTTMSGITQNLFLDIYQPRLDTVTRRPLIIFIHGGAFVTGTRNEGRGYCITSAMRGYVAATIDYRLVDVPLVDSLTVTEDMVKAVSDTKAAIRFFVEDAATANIYKIDTNYIFIAGASAGAITAAHTAYLNSTDNIPTFMMNFINNNGGFAGNSSTNKQYTTPIKGVVSYSGGLARKDWISSGEPNMFSVHDVGDSIVRCNYGLSAAFPFPIYLYGTCEMKQEADLKGVYNDTLLFPDNSHGGYLQDIATITLVLQRTADFLSNLICTNPISIDETLSNQDFLLFPNPASTTLNIKLDNLQPSQLKIITVLGQEVLNKQIQNKENMIDVSALSNGIYFAIINTNGTSIIKKFMVNRE